jgi:hypothetical protein
MATPIPGYGGRPPLVTGSRDLQRKKLACKDSDWKLPGTTKSTPVTTRTRGNGTGRPSFSHRKKLFIEPLTSDSEEEELHEDDDDLDSGDEFDAEFDEELLLVEDELMAESNSIKPNVTRVIVEVEGLMETLEKHCRCPTCDGPMEPQVETLCVASIVSITCKNKSCAYVHYTTAAKAKIGCQDAPSRARSTDSAINVLYVLGFISVGDGCTEAARVLGLLGLPNDTTMESRSFTYIEERISPYIHQLTDAILHENLSNEVRLSVDDPVEFQHWTKAQLEGALPLSARMYPKLSASFDMAWQQRNSGNRYNSASGHALFVGGKTRLPISYILKSKLCCYCRAWSKRHDPAIDPSPPHNCKMNHEGSSGAMEAQSCLDMTIALYDNKQVVIDVICIDDDASTRSMLKWSNADYMKNHNTSSPPTAPISKGPNKGKQQVRPDKGKLPPHIPEPSFVADPNHRKKVLTGELIALALARVSEKHTMTKNDSTRLGKNFGYMIRNLHKFKGDEDLCYRSGQAVLEHHFDNHEFCGLWCPRVRMTAEQLSSSDRFYRSKTKDAKLYKVLHEKISRFVTTDRLKEVAHQMDTQVNESFNNSVAWLAPKNKVYCGTSSLGNRVGIALGIKSIGMLQYFTRLFKLMGINLTPNVAHYLNCKDNSRFKRLNKIKSKEVKSNRMQLRITKMKEDEVVAKRERSKRDGTYKTGQNMMPVQDDVLQLPPKKKSRKDLVCNKCGKSGHATIRSRACNFYQPRAITRQPVARTDVDTGAPDAAADLDEYDCFLQLNEDDPSSDVEDVTLEVILNAPTTETTSTHCTNGESGLPTAIL